MSGARAAPPQANRPRPAPAPTITSPLTRPDLAIRGVSILPAAPTMTAPPQAVTQLKTGQKYTLVCRYANIGTDLTGVWKLGYYIDGEMVNNQYWGPVPAGAEQTKSYVGWVAPGVGSHTYECRLDYDREVVERSETNNQASMSFQVVP
jgi:subtilase family serine protease